MKKITQVSANAFLNHYVTLLALTLYKYPSISENAF